MNIIGRVLIIAACVFTAYAWPNLSIPLSDGNMKGLFSHMSPFAANNTNNSTNNTNNSNNTNNTNSTNAQDICFLKYSNRTNEINAQTRNQSQTCYDFANRALAQQNNVTNQTVNSVNALSKQLQATLSGCASKNSSEAILNCYVASFDQNLNNLYNLTSQSQLTVAYINSYPNQIDALTHDCVSNVLISSQVNSTAANNDLQSCLNNNLRPGNKTTVL